MHLGPRTNHVSHNRRLAIYAMQLFCLASGTSSVDNQLFISHMQPIRTTQVTVYSYVTGICGVLLK